MTEMVMNTNDNIATLRAFGTVHLSLPAESDNKNEAQKKLTGAFEPCGNNMGGEDRTIMDKQR